MEDGAAKPRPAEQGAGWGGTNWAPPDAGVQVTLQEALR